MIDFKVPSQAIASITPSNIEDKNKEKGKERTGRKKKGISNWNYSAGVLWSSHNRKNNDYVRSTGVRVERVERLREFAYI